VAETPARQRSSSYVGLTIGSVALLVGAVVLAVLLRGAFNDAHRTLGWVIACSVVALLLDALVDALDRVMPRLLAVVTVLLVVLGVTAAIVFGVAREVLDSLAELRESAPAAAARLEEGYGWARDIGVAERVEDFVDDFDSRLRSDAVAEALTGVPTYLITGILMLFVLAYGPRYVRAFVEQFAPSRRPALSTVLRSAALRGRTYLLLTLGHSILNGVIVGAVCWALGVTASVSLGVAVGALTILPLLGILVGGVPACLLAFGLEGRVAGAVVVAVIVGLQLVEAIVVRPLVDARTVRLGPAVAIVVGLVGFELYGIGGAVYGLALAVIGLAALDAAGRIRGETPAVPPGVPEHALGAGVR